MSQDKEAMIVLALGILFCLIIVIASNSTDHSTIQLIDQWMGTGASSVQYGLTEIGLAADTKDNLLRD
jgi:hypothetical protein